MRPARWLLPVLLAAGLGWAVGEVLHLKHLAASDVYQVAALSLLAIGLFGSTAGISLDIAKKDLGTIVFATTAGVLVKAALITGGMMLVDPEFAILGLVVAQIDPLSVAAILRRSAMSERAKTILQAWSSFDDPMTTLLTIYAISWLVHSGRADASDAGMLGYAGGLWFNALFVAGAYALWRLLRLLRRTAKLLLAATPADHRSVAALAGPGQLVDGGKPAWGEQALPIFGRVWQVVLIVALAGLAALAVHHVLMLGLAVTGLFFRPRIDRLLPGMLQGALLTATFALGLLLADGVQLWKGFLLAALAWGAQVVVTWLLPTRLSRQDRRYLALGQQNGITAIILALTIEPALPGTVAIVAPAILVINVIHLVTNSLLDRPGVIKAA